MVNKLYTITNISLFIIIIIFCLLLMSSTDIFQIKKVISFLYAFQKNHLSKFIHSIIAINSKENCPDNSFPLQFYTYPGTYNGCLISGNKLEKDSCTFIDKLFKKAKEIKETEKKNFNNIFSKKLCAISLNENNYLSNLNENKNVDNKKFCGILDTIGTEYYVDIDKKCPINKIIINNKAIINDEKATFISIELIKDKYYLHFSNDYTEKDNNILINDSFIISEGYPCINPEEINTYHIQYLLSKANNTYICETNIDNKRLDTRFSPIINIKKNELYKDNDILLENYFKYPFQDVELTLYQRGYIGTNSYFNSKIIPDINKLISDINNIYDLNKINQLIKKIIYSFIFIVIVSLICKYFISDKTIHIWNFILLAVILVNLIINIIIHILLDDLSNLENFKSDNNKDEIFNLQINYIKSLIKDSRKKNYKNIIGDILLFFCVGIFNILNYCYFNNPKRNILKYKSKTDYRENNKFFNSINVLKPTSFDIKKQNLMKFKEEIELPKIDNEKNEENFMDISKDEEENNLTNDKNE